MSVIVRSTPRRALLASAAVAALAAIGFLGAHPLSVGAATKGSDGDVVLGVDFQSTTFITGVSTTATVGLHGDSTNANGIGVRGDGGSRGVYGSGNDTGVLGEGGTDGVFGTGTDTGVVGQGGAYGVEGDGTTDGVEGFGGPDGVYGQGNTNGVEGSTTTGSGVYGHNSGQTGVGVSGTTGGVGSGVAGEATANGIGVAGRGNTGIGVLAISPNGTALWVNGAAHFSQSGLAVVPSGSKRVTVTMAGVTTASMILATVQQGGGFYVKYALPASGSFTIYINKAPTSPATVSVAFIVLS